MNLIVKTANGGYERNADKFFTENSEYGKVGIKMAFRKGGVKELEKHLKEDKTFKGKVSFVEEDTEDKIVYVGFTMPITYTKEQFDQDTGESLGEQEFTEDHSYLMCLVGNNK